MGNFFNKRKIDLMKVLSGKFGREFKVSCSDIPMYKDVVFNSTRTQ
jgi:hypothetical protein